MFVRFATVCDRCGRRSSEYVEWPTCRGCLDHICPSCQVVGSFKEGEGKDTCLCGADICDDDPVPSNSDQEPVTPWK